MHETTIASAILAKIIERLKDIKMPTEAIACKIQVGEFRNIDPQSLAFAFDSLKVNYPFTKNCLLNIKIVAAEATCKQNKHQYHPEEANFYACTICGDGIGKLTCGKELEIIHLTCQTALIESICEVTKS